LASTLKDHEYAQRASQADLDDFGDCCRNGHVFAQFWAGVLDRQSMRRRRGAGDLSSFGLGHGAFSRNDPSNDSRLRPTRNAPRPCRWGTDRQKRFKDYFYRGTASATATTVGSPNLVTHVRFAFGCRRRHLPGPPNRLPRLRRRDPLLPFGLVRLRRDPRSADSRHARGSRTPAKDVPRRDPLFALPHARGPGRDRPLAGEAPGGGLFWRWAIACSSARIRLPGMAKPQPSGDAQAVRRAGRERAGPSPGGEAQAAPATVKRGWRRPPARGSLGSGKPLRSHSSMNSTRRR
jgi:hypothetical protein